MIAVARWIMAAKDPSVLLLRRATRMNLLSLQKKFSTGWRALNRIPADGCLLRRYLRWGMTMQAPCVHMASTIQ
ncbi:hypothetical protein NJLHNGOC_02150 [Novacetimonas cocois]|uniref:Uncharacterized protein n=1 Tax=Novacetimonas cocois TaxID=1747507 RepID=A0A365Z004_9PROT|nr:hypothetical protein NJLHNGOC_02150 [Novacetimonas cocois]